MSFNSEMTALADAIRNKAGISDSLTIAEMREAVDSIEINQGSDIDFSGVNVTADKMLSGVVAINASGSKVTGNIPTVTATKSSNKVTVPAGHIASQQIVTVGTAKSAATITPGTSDQTIAADTYLSGKQTIKGDANLTAENIKSGVSIFNVAGTFEGTGGGGTGGSGTFDLAKVTEYIPYSPEITAVTSVVVSGIGDLIWSDDPESEDYEYNEYYSEANGTYIVTPETAGETDWKKRIYKHESKEYYLFYEYYDDYPDESTWFFSTSADSDGQFIRKYNEWDWDTDEPLPVGDLESGESEWGDYDWEPFNVTLDVTKTNYPELPATIKGVMAKRYDIDEDAWVLGSSEIVLDGVLNTPKVGGLYVIANGHTVGMAIASDSEAVIPAGFTSNTSIPGYVVDQSHGAGSYPDAYVVFNQIADRDDYAWYTGNIGVSTSNPAWFSIELPKAIQPSGIMIMNEIETPENFKTAIFQGSNNGSSWTDLYTINNSPNTAGYKKEYSFECNTAYRYFRMLFTASYNSGVSVQCFQIFKKSFIVE